MSPMRAMDSNAFCVFLVEHAVITCNGYATIWLNHHTYMPRVSWMEDPVCLKHILSQSIESISFLCQPLCTNKQSWNDFYRCHHVFLFILKWSIQSPTMCLSCGCEIFSWNVSGIVAFFFGMLTPFCRCFYRLTKIDDFSYLENSNDAGFPELNRVRCIYLYYAQTVCCNTRDWTIS